MKKFIKKLKRKIKYSYLFVKIERKYKSVKSQLKRESYYDIIWITKLTENKKMYKCHNCRVIEEFDYPYCPYCGFKMINAYKSTINARGL